MAKLQSAKQLKEYCLRRLGSPVINIEVEDTQSTDRIDDAIQFFIERHYDGVEEVYFKKTITPFDVRRGYVNMDDRITAVTDVLSINRDSVEVMDDFEYRLMEEYNNQISITGQGVVDYYITKTYMSMLRDIFGSSTNSYEFNMASHKFYLRDGLSSVGSSELLTGDWTGINAVFTELDTETPNGELDGSTVTCSGAGTFGITQDYSTNWYVRGTYTIAVSLLAGTYTGNVIITLKDRNGTEIAKDVVLLDSTMWTREYVVGSGVSEHVNDITVTIEAETAGSGGETFHTYSESLYKNNFVVLRGYRAVDPAEDIDVYNDSWLKRYATAMIKMQWGSNLSKFDNIQLPSGVTMNGEQIFQAAMTEIDKLEIDFAQRFEEPDNFFIG